MIARRLMTGLLAASVWVAGCGSEKAVSQPLTPVGVASVESYSGGEGSRYSATIVPYAQVSVAFKSAGYVTKVTQVRGADGNARGLDPGDWVTRGKILAVVREDDYRNKVQHSAGNLSKAQAAAQNAKQEFDRASMLLAAQALTQPAYDAAKSQLDASNASVVVAEAELKEAELALRDCTLVAPMDGWITSRGIEVGDLAASGTIGFTIVDTNRVKAVFGLPDTLLSSIRLGQAQEVATEALSEEFQGRITLISPQADPKSRVFPVEVTIPNPHGRLKVGMVATLSLGAGLAHAVLVVPLSAIVSPANGSKEFAVFVLAHEGDRDIARQRRVQLGETYGNRVAVLQGLTLGDRVIAIGATQVTDGQAVKIAP
ncbi:MAG: efflux RND transporter periplasmic adaptor subunit [Candidatus Acidiferrales bacterium]